MADFFDQITPEQAKLIEESRVFFVASADPKLATSDSGAGPVNLSPKGGVPLHIISSTQVAYLDYLGSGNETARHSMAGGPITVMVCAFEQRNAAVVRLFGHATITELEDSPLAGLLQSSPASTIALPQRQAIIVDIESTSTSCGYGVPLMSFQADRTRDDRGRLYKQHKVANS